MKYKVLDSEYVKSLETAHNIKLVGKVVTGEIGKDYLHCEVDGIEFLFLLSEVKEVIEKRKLNKTAVINSIQVNKNDIDINIYNEIMSIKRKLRQCTLNDIESIEYSYRKLIVMCYQSGINQLSSLILSMLKKACELIIDSDIKVNCWEIDNIKDWINKGIC